MVAHAVGGLPMEACGLLIGVPGDSVVQRFVPTANDANSAKVYTVPGIEMLRAERDAENDELEIIGVMHSHTHTEAYPSATDVAQAPDPAWHYVIVSLSRGSASLRSFRIVDGLIDEEPIELT